MNKGIIGKLEQRGYWRVEIRPTVFEERRIDSTKALQRAVEKARVELRGWDFPHIGRSWDLPDKQSSVGVDTDWSVHVEIWRAFLSGQFVYRGGVRTDWLDQHHYAPEPDVKPQTRMPIVSTLWSLTEFFEFAARYSQTDAGDDSMFVQVSFHGMKGRFLLGDHERRLWVDTYGPAQLDEFVFARTLSRSDLITSAARLAVTCGVELYSLFGWDTGPELLDVIQAELFQFKRGA